MTTELDTTQESQSPSIVNELDDIEEAGLMYIKGYKVSEISTVMNITPKKARKYINDYKQVLSRRTEEDPYFLSTVFYKNFQVVEYTCLFSPCYYRVSSEYSVKGYCTLSFFSACVEYDKRILALLTLILSI